MNLRRPFALVFCLFASLLWIMEEAYADRIGQPYRGPKELLSGGGGGGDTGGTDTGDAGGTEGGGGEGGEGGEGGGGEGGGSEGGGSEGGTTPGGGASTGGAGGKKAKLDGQVLWQWWWEHNKDRFLARAATPGRIRMNSAEYWFGAGAKYPPRELESISDTLRKTKVFTALQQVVAREPNDQVVAEACIALGRIAFVAAGEKEKKEGQSDNLVVRELIGVLGKNKDKDVRTSAILALGMTGHADAAAYLMRNYQQFSTDEKPWVHVAFGLAQHEPAIAILVAALPKSARAKAAGDDNVAAITGLGLMGMGALPEIEKQGGIERLEKLIDGRGNDPTVMQAVTALGRLQAGRDKLTRLVRSKSSKNINWTTILALANYSADEKDAEKAAKALQGNGGFKSGDSQNKSFAILALGDLASRLPSTSNTRGKILDFLKKEALDTKNNYLRSSACIALGVAGDTTAIPEIAALVSDKTGADYVAGAAAVGLGLLRATDHADAVRQTLMLKRTWNDDARGYGALGLALMGDTTRVSELITFSNSTLSSRAERQIPIAMSVLGDKNNVGRQLGYFAKPWKSKDRFKSSNGAFGMAWMRDQSAVNRLVTRATTHADANVRGLAVVALGYCSSRDRVSQLTRCFENVSHRNRFGNWDVIRYIAHIL